LYLGRDVLQLRRIIQLTQEELRNAQHSSTVPLELPVFQTTTTAQPMKGAVDTSGKLPLTTLLHTWMLVSSPNIVDSEVLNYRADLEQTSTATKQTSTAQTQLLGHHHQLKLNATTDK